MYAIAADMLMILHFAFIFFVVVGQALFILGHHRHWRWVRNGLLRRVHLASVALVVVQTWARQHCPLTLWEKHFRLLNGQAPYGESFIAHWLGRIIYFDAPQYVFQLVYTVFGLLVLLYWCLRKNQGQPSK